MYINIVEGYVQKFLAQIPKSGKAGIIGERGRDMVSKRKTNGDAPEQL
jgi:hypothetical protein